MRYQLAINYGNLSVAPFVDKDAFAAVLDALRRYGATTRTEILKDSGEDCKEVIAEENGREFVVGWIYGGDI